MVRTIRGLISVTRPLNGLIGFFGCLVGARLASGALASWDAQVWWAAVSIGLAVLGADAINDAFDVEIDRINRPKRPIPSGAVSVRQVVLLALAIDMLAVVVGLFASPTVALITLLSIVANLLYSWKLKAIPVVGNAAIAALYTVPLALGGLAQDRWGDLTIPLITTGLFAFGREILMDARDREGDRHSGALSLAALIGVRPAILVATACFSAALAVGLIPGLTGRFTVAYTVIIVIAFVTTLGFMAYGWRGRTFRDLQLSAGATKAVLVLSMVALAIAPQVT